MRRLIAPCSFKFREKASIVLTELHPAPDAEARAGALAALRRRDHDATHHCSAWREGVPIAAWGADDDGEPSGTAGGPMLRVLEGAGATDLIAVCIRWYGGTKLGSGGLVRAYTEGVQGALAEADAQALWEEVWALRRGAILVGPSQAHLPFSLFGAFPDLKVLDQGFQDGLASVRFELPMGQEAGLERQWRERSRGGGIQWE